MGKFGDKLKREREMRGVTLDEIADATKIGTRSLKALEEERFDQLPGGIFNKGFVRAYARFLGLDEEQAVADYQAAFSEQPNRADVLEKMAAQAEAIRKNEAAAAGGADKSSNKAWVVVAIMLLLAFGAVAGWRYYQKIQQQKMSAQPPAQSQVPPPVVQTSPAAPTSDANGNSVSGSVPGATSGSANATLTQGAQTSPATDATSVEGNKAAEPTKPQETKTVGGTKPAIELQIHVTRATWLSVQADGKEATTETLRDSATKTVVAQDRVVLTTGNSVEVTCNGTSLGILGEDNKRSQLRITSGCKVN